MWRLALRPPVKRYRLVKRVAHRRAGALGFQVRSLQFEIPARLAVRIVHEHHAIFIFQTERLLANYFRILANESRAEDVNDERDDRKPWKNIPGGDEIEAAEIVSYRCDRRAAGKPVAAGANLFEPLVGQNEINHRGGRLAGYEFQDFVGRAVCRGCVGAHAKALRNRLKLL